MEVLRMNYYLQDYYVYATISFFVEPAYPRNEYLNEYGVRCGRDLK